MSGVVKWTALERQAIDALTLEMFPGRIRVRGGGWPREWYKKYRTALAAACDALHEIHP